MPSKKSVVNVAEVDLSDAEILCSGRRSHRFSDWETTEVEPRPGVYTVWDKPDGEQERFVYVGMAGRGVLATDLDAPDEPKRKRGLHGRLKAHASGKRSGDQFCVYVCDYFVVPMLGDDEHRKIATWQLYLDDLTQDRVGAAILEPVTWSKKAKAGSITDQQYLDSQYNPVDVADQSAGRAECA